MRCPYSCGSHKFKLIRKREAGDSQDKRRRECLLCGKRFTTYERVDPRSLGANGMNR